MKTLGPYAALISRIIKKRSNENNNGKIVGEFIVYRGFSLPESNVDKWKKKKQIVLKGYSSSSLDESIARFFAKNSKAEGQ